MKQQKVKASLIAKSLLFAFCLTLVTLAGTFRPGFTQSREGRKIKVRTFTRMPLEVKEIRNLQNEDWIRDLEIEVKNISRHPIYFISLTLEFPDVPQPPGPAPTPHPETGYTPAMAAPGFGISYGPDRMTDVSQLAGPDDVPLKPGETYVFKVPQSRVLGYESMNRTMNLSPEVWNRIELSFSFICLGDGTGYVGGSRELNSKKKKSSDAAQ
jgi:hypothetical protein